MKFTIGKNSFYKIINKDDKMIATGFCGILEHKILQIPDFMLNKNVKSIMGFFVISEEQNKGIGKKLLNYIIENEKKQGTDFISLGVRYDNERAIKLYKGSGFIESGVCERYKEYLFMYIDLGNTFQ